tara:strand:+ start:314 stop:538 length:225 start_codon:yes stop_codon:yes gene_type:complete
MIAVTSEVRGVGVFSFLASFFAFKAFGVLNTAGCETFREPRSVALSIFCLTTVQGFTLAKTAFVVSQVFSSNIT